ncbi:MAG TPA: Clp protease N-terminal domain-containing protein [Pyrinomonadaceae bacterium]|nr:Clp protease N-terminal domain-containing protein [Pyrinomonadaceae bacterium]
MATLETYRQRFAESGWQIFELAHEEAKRRGQNYLGVEHVLYALAQVNAEIFSSLLRSLANNPDALSMLLKLIEESVAAAPIHEGEGVRLAPEAIELFKLTLRRVRFNGRRRIEATDLFITLLMEEESLMRELIRQLLADPRGEAKEVRNLVTLVESVGAGRRPTARQRFVYSVDEMVRIKSGPFAAFTGRVEKVNENESTLTVRVYIMGRQQPVELRFLDVEKIDFI